MFVDTGLSIVADCDRCWVAIPATESTGRLREMFAFEFSFLGVFSTIGKLLSCDTCADRFSSWCDGGLHGVKMSTVRNSEIWFVWVVCPVSMWLRCGCRSKCVPGTDYSLISSGTLFRVSSFVINTCNLLFLSETLSKGAFHFVFPTFWICRDTGCVSSRGRVYWLNC